MHKSHIDWQVQAVSVRTPELVAELADLWAGSVAATHHFLPDRIQHELRPFVEAALWHIPVLLLCSRRAADGTHEPCGFAGIAGKSLEMLFVKDTCLGTGAGSALLQQAIGQYGVTKTSVNEQNPAAYAFYRRHGFVCVYRADKDDQGRPFPILYLQLTDKA